MSISSLLLFILCFVCFTEAAASELGLTGKFLDKFKVDILVSVEVIIASVSTSTSFSFQGRKYYPLALLAFQKQLLKLV